MPPRLPKLSRSGTSTFCLRPISNPSTLSNVFLPLVSKAHASTEKKHRDTWALAQIKAKKNASLNRRNQLIKERTMAIGNPVRGTTTPFIASLDMVGGAALPSTITTIDPDTKTVSINSQLPILNHFTNPAELEKAIQHSSNLMSPYINTMRDSVDPAIERSEMDAYEEDYRNAIKAIPPILSLHRACSADRTRANVQRCIDTFGRHKTDSFLTPRPPINPDSIPDDMVLQEKTPRAGPDTGSSEVQIAILTVKIKRLADELLKKGARSRDKVGKRDLRLLVHRRQKLLKYLRRKERGGGRWEHVTDMLGLGEGTWKGEISL